MNVLEIYRIGPIVVSTMSAPTGGPLVSFEDTILDAALNSSMVSLLLTGKPPIPFEFCFRHEQALKFHPHRHIHRSISWDAVYLSYVHRLP